MYLKKIRKRFLVYLLVGAIASSAVFSSYSTAKNVKAVFPLPAVAAVMIPLLAVVGVKLTADYYLKNSDAVNQALYDFGSSVWNSLFTSHDDEIMAASFDQFLANASGSGTIAVTPELKKFLSAIADNATFLDLFPEFDFLDAISTADMLKGSYIIVMLWGTSYYYFISDKKPVAYWRDFGSSISSVSIDSYSNQADIYRYIMMKQSDGSYVRKDDGYIASVGMSRNAELKYSTFTIYESRDEALEHYDEDALTGLPMDNSANQDIAQKVDGLGTTFENLTYGQVQADGSIVEQIPVAGDITGWIEGTWSDAIADNDVIVLDPATDTVLVGEGAVDVPITPAPSLPNLPTEVPDTIDGLKVDLTKVFPFCVPFDLVRAVSVFNQEPVAPRIQYTLNVRPLGFSYTFDIDLSEFDTVAAICRTMFLFAFIVGLIMATRQLIRG